MEGAGEQRKKAFLKAYSPYLVPVLVLGQHQDDLAALASTLGAIAFAFTLALRARAVGLGVVSL